MNKSRFIDFVAYAYPLISTFFFGASFISLELSKGLYFVLTFLMIIFVSPDLISKSKSPIANNVRNYTLCLIFSMVMSFLIWHQSFILSFRSTAPILAILYFFFLKKIHFPKEKIEYLIIGYTVLWIVAWGTNLMLNNIIFGSYGSSRGIDRFFIPGDCFIYLCFFLFVNKWIANRKKIQGAIALLLFILIVLQVTRQTIAFSAFVALYYILKKHKYIMLYLVGFLLLLQFQVFRFSQDSPITQLVTLSEEQYTDNEQGDTYVRILEYNFFLKEFNKNELGVLLGNGVPHDDSEYGKNILFNKYINDYYISDVGYAGVFVYTGIIGLFFFFRMIKTVCIYDSKENYVYFGKMYLMFIFLCNILSFVFCSHIISVAIAFYILDKNEDHTLSKL